MKNSPDTKQPLSIKRGDVFKLGDHILICDDAQRVNLDTVLPKPIDLILTDPPYGIDYVESKRGFGDVQVDKDIANDQPVSDETYLVFTQAWLARAIPRLESRNTIYVFNSDKMVFALREAMVQLGMKVSLLIIWVKDRAVIGRLDYLPQHELILYGWHGRHDFKHSKDKTVIFSSRPASSKLHPTMKPVRLLRKLILNSTDVGDLVYDPFGGSGSTLIACEQTKRKCVMVEIDPAYCETIIRRWEKLKNGTKGNRGTDSKVETETA